MAEYKEQIERLTERIAALRQSIRSQAPRHVPQLQRDEPSNAQNILAAPVSQYAPRQERGSVRGFRIR